MMPVLSHISKSSGANYVVKYAREVYDIRIICRNDLVFIMTKQETYKVEFDSSCHKYIFTSELGSVVRDSFFERGLFKIACKLLYNEIGLTPTTDDWRRFFDDAYKYGVM